jgi:hypothetical protein
MLAVGSCPIDCESGGCKSHSIALPFVSLGHDQEAYQQLCCATCGHATGTVDGLAAVPGASGNMTVKFQASCAATNNYGYTLWEHKFEVSQLPSSVSTGEQGAKDRCGENADVVWSVTVENNSSADLSGTIRISCPRRGESSGQVLAPSAVR